MDLTSISHNYPEYTVSELADSVKRTVEQSFGMVRIRGEISGFKLAPSQHGYFSLKDQNAILSAVCFKQHLVSLKNQPEEGMEVVCTGKLTTYPGRSQYQLIVENIEPAGLGAWMALLEKRKEAFLKEGLFDQIHKRSLPFLPKTIGIITSPTGAVIKDMLHRIEERCPTHILLWPVKVQGDQAATEIAAAIAGFERLHVDGELARPDVLIVARGGGSIEDLWPFNEEIVVRAAFACRIPIISAIGHETDTTLIDYVADMRAPTPTAAAEFVVPVRLDLLAHLTNQGARIDHTMRRRIEQSGTMVAGMSRGLTRTTMQLDQLTQRLDHASIQCVSVIKQVLTLMERSYQQASLRLTSPVHYLSLQESLLAQTTVQLKHVGKQLEEKLKTYQANLHMMLKASLERCHFVMQTATQSLSHLTTRLASADYRSILARGFALIRDEKGQAVTRYEEAITKSTLCIEFADGAFNVTPASSNPKKGKKADVSLRQKDL